MCYRCRGVVDWFGGPFTIGVAMRSLFEPFEAFDPYYVAANSAVGLAALASALAVHMPSGGISEDAVRHIVSQAVLGGGGGGGGRTVVSCDYHGCTNEVVGAHHQLADVLGLVREGHHNLLLVGPAGSGKTTLAQHVADSLGLSFTSQSMSAGVSESVVVGRMVIGSGGAMAHQPSPFCATYAGGGVHLWDELDAADANLCVSMNAALANGFLVMSDGTRIERHADCFILAAMNTFGTGASAEYVGRNQLDAATLDRFALAITEVGYSGAMESAISGDFPEVLDWVINLRECITTNRLRRIASTRLVAAAVRARRAGTSMAAVKRRYFSGWTPAEMAKVGEA